ncbi:hypothetical protein H4R33_002065 [Dimargaris cristalligena]|uniref:5'-deoxynucleotidase n=1 Tax=Dimargaris cristalligena TaxID=215637 RepID=A0A4P9ZN06_9FUNG|nr:hypothetical protein H4R33_002065 [Dimargaris cristalligena]RKP34643.1 HD domain-containing protein [Dimargaris cristalligena]|eukprot:RKP34643.1 HD domain-containing protein [Dimargaris cristalligena]
MSTPAETQIDQLLDFLHIVEKLKRTKRTGWINSGINQPESIADHMYRMSIMSMLIEDPSLDRNRCIKMSLVHDLAESIVGDITPFDGVTESDKHDRERRAMLHISELLGHSAAAAEMVELWQEYEACETAEARLVKDLDKFEMIIQAVEYEKSDAKSLDSFFESTRGKFRHPQVQAWVERLYLRRNCLN